MKYAAYSGFAKGKKSAAAEMKTPPREDVFPTVYSVPGEHWLAIPRSASPRCHPVRKIRRNNKHPQCSTGTQICTLFSLTVDVLSLHLFPPCLAIIILCKVSRAITRWFQLDVHSMT